MIVAILTWYKKRLLAKAHRPNVISTPEHDRLEHIAYNVIDPMIRHKRPRGRKQIKRPIEQTRPEGL